MLIGVTVRLQDLLRFGVSSRRAHTTAVQYVASFWTYQWKNAEFVPITASAS